MMILNNLKELLRIESNSGDNSGDEVSSARKVVWAFDVPPSKRSYPPGWSPVEPLTNEIIETLYGSRFRNGWVAKFERRGKHAPPDGAVAAQTHVSSDVLEYVYFLVASDVRNGDELSQVMSTMQESTPAATTPYAVWHFVDGDKLWKAGVVPIRQQQTRKLLVVDCGSATQTFS
jgi:hypothetical protein